MYIAKIISLFTHNLLPMFLLIGTGALIQRLSNLDLRTLNRINLYVFVPALMFAKLIEADIRLGQAGLVAVLFSVNVMVIAAVALLVSRLLKPTRDASRAIALASAFSNTGNYGIPLMELAFGAVGVALQSVILMVNNILVYTIGMFLVASRTSAAQTAKTILGQPVIYAFIAALVVKGTRAELPGPLLVYVRYLGNGLVPIALITLGAQLTQSSLTHARPSVGLAVGFKLLVAPLSMAALVFAVSALGIPIPKVAAQVLILSAAIPSAVNTVILSMEFDADPDIVASTILVGTVLSALTVSMALFLLGA